MDEENMKKKLETGKCLLVAQEGKGKSDLWKTFDVVVETRDARYIGEHIGISQY
jgi:hypothetical protein